MTKIRQKLKPKLTKSNFASHIFRIFSHRWLQFQIQEQLRALKKSTQDCGVEVERTRQLQETHSINFYKHHQISGSKSKIFCVSRFVSSTLTLIDRKEQLRARNHSKRGQFYIYIKKWFSVGLETQKNFDFFFHVFFFPRIH